MIDKTPGETADKNKAELKRIRINLYMIPLFVFLSRFVILNDTGIKRTSFSWGIAIAESVFFIVLGFLAKTKPYGSTLAGIIGTVIFGVTLFIVFGSVYIRAGLIIRLFVIGILLYNLKAAKSMGNGQ